MRGIGFSGYLGKPISQTALYCTLQGVVGIATDDSYQSHHRRKRELPQFDASVLVVDDNTINQTVAQGMLQKFGVQVEVASNGAEAIRHLEQRTYNLVFMDCQMPVLDGYNATQQIRDPDSKVKQHDIPVIAMTANAMRGDREKCVDAGMDDYVSKPVDISKLTTILEAWLLHPEGLKVDKVMSEDAKSDMQQPSQDAAIFDYEGMSSRLCDDVDLIRAVTEAVLEEMPDQIEQLRSLISAGEVEQAGAQAHKIKGAASNVGGVTLSAQALKLEQAGKLGELSILQEGIDELENSFTHLQSAMKQRMA